VRVVAACVHHPDLATEVRGAHARGEGNVHFFRHGQRIHVGAQRHHGFVTGATQHADHTGMGNVGAHLHSERLQVFGDEGRGAKLAIRELRVLVEVAAPLDHLALQLRRPVVDRLRGGGGGAVCPGPGRCRR
jgi:hypothetical protein